MQKLLAHNVHISSSRKQNHRRTATRLSNVTSKKEMDNLLAKFTHPFIVNMCTFCNTAAAVRSADDDDDDVWCMYQDRKDRNFLLTV